MKEIYFTDQRQRIVPDEDRTWEGGEGKVFIVKNKPGLAGKIYNPENRTVDRQRKIDAMLASGFEDPSSPPRVAWPTAILLDNLSRFAGFLMPSAGEGSETLQEICTRILYEKKFPRRSHYRIALNVCKAVQQVHRAGFCIGDFHEKNVMWSKGDRITLIDVDSFNLIDSQGQRFPTPNVLDEYVAPELQDYLYDELEQIDWQPHHDYFPLAIHIFKLLLGNCHPFAGVKKLGEPEKDYHLQLLKKGIYPHVHNPEASPPKGCQVTFVPKSIRKAFERTFSNGHNDPAARLSPDEWISLLEEAESSLKRCYACSDEFERHHSVCPFCRNSRHSQSGPDKAQKKVETKTKKKAVIPTPQPPPPVPSPRTGKKWLGIGVAASIAVAAVLAPLIFNDEDKREIVEPSPDEIRSEPIVDKVPIQDVPEEKPDPRSEVTDPPIEIAIVPTPPPKITPPPQSPALPSGPNEPVPSIPQPSLNPGDIASVPKSTPQDPVKFSNLKAFADSIGLFNSADAEVLEYPNKFQSYEIILDTFTNPDQAGQAFDRAQVIIATALRNDGDRQWETEPVTGGDAHFVKRYDVKSDIGKIKLYLEQFESLGEFHLTFVAE